MRHSTEDVRYGMAFFECKWAATFGATTGCHTNHAELLPDKPCIYCRAWL